MNHPRNASTQSPDITKHLPKASVFFWALSPRGMRDNPSSEDAVSFSSFTAVTHTAPSILPAERHRSEGNRHRFLLQLSCILEGQKNRETNKEANCTLCHIEIRDFTSHFQQMVELLERKSTRI